MSNASRHVLCALHRKPMAACVAAFFWLSAPWVHAANTWTVTSCSDSGSGTLRDTIAAATTLSGDTVDLSQLPTTYGCSTISLQTGAVAITQSGLNLQGPGTDSLKISGGNGQQVLMHTGTGSVGIYDLSIIEGYVYSANGAAKGGCIYSAGTMILKHVKVAYCTAYTNQGSAQGGGIYTVGGLTLKYSTLESNVANGGYATSVGGGAVANGPFLGKYSTVTGNFATSRGFGGGLYLHNNATIVSSTISANQSDNNIGGLALAASHPASLTATITNSTISGNFASSVTGGLYANFGTVKINNSTIAFNSARYDNIPPYYYSYYSAPGVALGARYGSIVLNMQSTLISNNTVGSVEDDLSIIGVSAQNTITFDPASANNLIRVVDNYSQSILPGGTIMASCPLLGPLRDNGGVTKTHALLSTSPAIDGGNNTTTLNEDQRGVLNDTSPFPYPRQSGSTPDIGAYEVQQDDIIFNSGWDGCLAAEPESPAHKSGPARGSGDRIGVTTRRVL
jgi:hypothetical protein